ncbi:tetratricopeptide repeat protein [Bacillus sp. OK048]|uniref:tetratricopeptide repeat protein n=1 Tax=Bacillus sp. OK048 TaxID=1882761 RepID=UPI00088A83BD|nr:tetratricopeptide repeat protein [Bacillus sp. OK048]SDN59810.1 Tetratrico peptide repeat-containing protein [Bacillus sp. OK048]
MEPKWETVVMNGWENKDDETKLIEYFLEVVDKYPNSARAKFELANAYDFTGQENKAISLYEDSISIGLDAEYEAYALLQLGSSLRNVGRIDDAIRILSDAEQRYPEFPSISMFLGIAMHDKNRNAEALRKNLNVMLRHVKTSDIERYRMALENYIKDIKS